MICKDRWTTATKIELKKIARRAPTGRVAQEANLYSLPAVVLARSQPLRKLGLRVRIWGRRFAGYVAQAGSARSADTCLWFCSNKIFELHQKNARHSKHVPLIPETTLKSSINKCVAWTDTALCSSPTIGCISRNKILCVSRLEA